MCVDLSQRSLSRAKFRCSLTRGKTTFIRGDINEVLELPAWKNTAFSHIEAYGVLHHIPSTSSTVTRLASRLADGGTMRVMVYNAKARDWIWQANRAFRLLGLRYDKDADIQVARNILAALAHSSRRLAGRLQQMGSRSLANDTRFADTFLHPWESRLELAGWLKILGDAGLTAHSLLDRYAELDDLPNPLWTMPTAHQLTDRSADLRFENNLEIWLCRSQSVRSMDASGDQAPPPLALRTRTPPSLWKRFPETRTLGILNLWTLWQGWLESVHDGGDLRAEKVIRSLPLISAQRLARIGAITASQAKACGLYKELLRPIHTTMEAPALDPSTPTPEFGKNIQQHLNSDVGVEKLKLALMRLERIS